MSDMTEQQLQEIKVWVAQELAYLCEMGCTQASPPFARMKAVEALVAEVRRLREQLHTARRNEMPWNLENVARRWGWDGQQALSCFFDDQIYARHTELVRGQLHGPSCPYRGGDEDSCTCRPEELASRWKAQWLLVKTERDAVQSALDSLVVMAHTNPTQPLAHALRTVPITVAIVSQDVSVLPEAPHGEEA